MGRRAFPSLFCLSSSGPFTSLSNTQFNFVTVNFNGASRIQAYFPGIEGADDNVFLSHILDGIHPVLYRVAVGSGPVADPLVPANADTRVRPSPG
jgi:hypothetical protein